MSLPPALLKKLANRGLVSVNNKGSEDQKAKSIHQNEEIIAEDYDEVEDPSQYDYEPAKKPEENFWKERMKRRIAEGNNTGYKGCPNKYNIYHKCTLYCVTRWMDGIVDPDREYLKRKDRLLKKYPLPKHWVEVYEFGLGIHYYWNKNDDIVSWLPPNHPKAILSKSAASLRKELEEIQPQNIEEVESEFKELTDEDIERILNSPMPPIPKVRVKKKVFRAESPSRYERHHQSSPVPLKKPKSRDLDKTLRQKAQRFRGSQRDDYRTSRRDDFRDRERSERVERRENEKSRNSNDNPLDPMDPAAYSDIPRGKWSDGLANEGGSQKSGAADPTVSGTAYQQRPYPSPGAVLQANSTSDRKRKENDGINSALDIKNKEEDYVEEYY
ncbi:polyglutamine-binding protein 1 [Condylostylus longicornis]|uniref:polyglutamine-binding protein 1 n=1 Tax=Condylostylus longicornis TaxID=2530218 RepID=UPI00244E07B1|nr:polyglutamine-binding protein 1 [Condylostylus longicornis]